MRIACLLAIFSLVCFAREKLNPLLSPGKYIFMSPPAMSPDTGHHEYRYGMNVIQSETDPKIIDSWYCADVPPGVRITKKFYDTAGVIANANLQKNVGSVGYRFSLRRRTNDSSYLEIKNGKISGGKNSTTLTVRLYESSANMTYAMVVSSAAVYTTRVTVRKDSTIRIPLNMVGDFQDDLARSKRGHGIGPASLQEERQYLLLLSNADDTVMFPRTASSIAADSSYINGRYIRGDLFFSISDQPFDVIQHARSNDYGHTWAWDVALMATAFGADHYSTCDPSVVYDGSYYYMAYTGIASYISGGATNCVYIARSTSVLGPWNKWNGTGWGGNPRPIIAYGKANGEPLTTNPAVWDWGYGEPSLVYMNGKMKIYYTLDSAKETSPRQILLRDVQVLGNDWPSKLSSSRVVYEFSMPETRRKPGKLSVKYIDEVNEYVGVGTIGAALPGSVLAFYSSNDGEKFQRFDTLLPAKCFGCCVNCHNPGIVSLPNGHIDLNRRNYLGYSENPEPIITKTDTNKYDTSYNFGNMPVKLHELNWRAGRVQFDFMDGK